MRKEVRQLVADATLDDFVGRLSVYISVGRTAVCLFLHPLKITRKKDSLRLRTTSVGRSFPTIPVGQTLWGHRREKTCFHRRNLGKNEHGSVVWLVGSRQTSY